MSWLHPFIASLLWEAALECYMSDCRWSCWNLQFQKAQEIVLRLCNLLQRAPFIVLSKTHSVAIPASYMKEPVGLCLAAGNFESACLPLCQPRLDRPTFLVVAVEECGIKMLMPTLNISDLSSSKFLLFIKCSRPMMCTY